MIKANRNDKALVVELLSHSFKDNLSVKYIIHQDKHEMRRVRALMDYSFEMCFLFGTVWLSDNRHGCALMLFPNQKRTTLKSIWLDVRLILQAIDLCGIGKAMKREVMIKQKQMPGPMMYLWFIGVNPLYQHRNTGSQLLAEVITFAQV